MTISGRVDIDFYKATRGFYTHLTKPGGDKTMEINFKYNVGDFIRIKHSPSTAVHVAERLVQQCPGGVQLHYSGKLYSASERWRRKDEDKEEFILAAKCEKFLEHELGEVIDKGGE